MERFPCPNMIGQLSGLLVLKDLEGVVRAVTNEASQGIGYKSFENHIGKTDFDMPCKASEFAKIFRRYDIEAIKDKKKNFSIDNQQTADGWQTLIVERTPIENSDGLIVGISNRAIDITGSSLSQLTLACVSNDSKFIGNKNQPFSYHITNEEKRKNLTLRQQECLFYLLRGYTYMGIGRALHISPRTVEDHLQNLYVAFDCRKKSQLIEKAIHEGYLMRVPKTLL